MIHIHLSKLLGERKMTRKQLSQLTGIREATIGKIYDEFCVYLSVEQLDMICEALSCDITELLSYTPNEVKKTGKFLIKERK